MKNEYTTKRVKNITEMEEGVIYQCGATVSIESGCLVINDTLMIPLHKMPNLKDYGIVFHEHPSFLGSNKIRKVLDKETEKEIDKAPELNLSIRQKKAYDSLLVGTQNIFLTGAAGTGKSYVINLFRAQSPSVPVLASTGMAAILVNGVTFHAFFCLGIMEGGFTKTLEHAIKMPGLINKLKRTNEIIIDEISMLSEDVLKCAEAICRKARNSKKPWGGIRIICVGDFHQLPPVVGRDEERTWVFNSDIWRRTGFEVINLKKVIRTRDKAFLKVLNSVRKGKYTRKVREFLDSRIYKGDPQKFDGTRILARRKSVDAYNLQRLSQIDSEEVIYETRYAGEEMYVERLKKSCVVPPKLRLKINALVMLRVNDKDRRFVNGTLAYVKKFDKNEIIVTNLYGKDIVILQHTFESKNGKEEIVAMAQNFPISLAWAITIHKCQGATIDKALLDLTNLWDPGQAYTALSRLKSPEGVHILAWDRDSIIADDEVIEYYESI